MCISAFFKALAPAANQSSYLTIVFADSFINQRISGKSAKVEQS